MSDAPKDELEAICLLAEELGPCDSGFVEEAEGRSLSVVLHDLAAEGGDAAIITEIAIRARRALKMLEVKDDR